MRGGKVVNSFELISSSWPATGIGTEQSGNFRRCPSVSIAEQLEVVDDSQGVTLGHGLGPCCRHRSPSSLFKCLIAGNTDAIDQSVINTIPDDPSCAF